MKLYKLYIGHDNKTKKRFQESIINNIINNYFEGFTIIKSDGYYKSECEQSYIIEILTKNQNKIKNLKSELLNTLEQESILLTTTNLEVEF